ncbi:MAG: right-handed parallel beta-helix repeat-containing protein [Capsulimonadaceae bacterium]|nr:right-handed parallel beta-helix repeat-containing protein [Capsulimonadaceae bacterium]
MKYFYLLAISVVLILSCRPTTSAATVYYVSASVSPGAAHTGAASDPFPTIAQAAKLVGPGDTVIVKPGIYRETVKLRASGTLIAPITFEAQPEGKAILTGADVVTGWKRVDGDAPIYSIDWNHTFSIGNGPDGKPVEHHPADAPLWGRAEQVIVDDLQLLPAAGLDDLRAAWLKHAATAPLAPTVPAPQARFGGPFAGAFAVDTNAQKLYAWLADGSDPNTHAVQASTRGFVFGHTPWDSKDGIHDIVVRGFVFRYGATFPQRAAVCLFGRNNLVENCVVEQMAGCGMSVNGTVRRCVIRDNGHIGGGAIGDGFVNEQCEWNDNSWKPINRDWEVGGDKICNVNGGTLRECVFKHNAGTGLWFDIDANNIRVTNCVLQDNDGDGVAIEISRNIQVDHNLFFGNKTGIAIEESQNCRVLNNTLVNNAHSDIVFREQGPRPLKTRDGYTIAYHDTADAVEDNVAAGGCEYPLSFGWWDNPFFGRHPNDTLAMYPTEEAFDLHLKQDAVKIYDPTQQGLTVDRNIYWSPAGKGVVLYGAPWRPKHKEFAGLASWNALTGFDKNSLVADPGFVNAASGDYRAKRTGTAAKLKAGWGDAPPDPVAWIKAKLADWQKAYVR